MMVAALFFQVVPVGVAEETKSFSYGEYPLFNIADDKVAIINEEICKNADEYISEYKNEEIPGCSKMFGFMMCGLDSYPDLLQIKWRGSDLAQGTWTKWWKGWSKSCMDWGYFSQSNASSLSNWQDSANITFTLKKKTTTTNTSYSYSGTLLKKEKNKSLSMRGNKHTYTSYSTSYSYKTLTTPSFNSPFIYFQNTPNTPFDVKVVSEFNNYKEAPEFSEKNTWSGELKDDQMILDGQSHDHLFYELDVNKVDLNRNGKNFDTQESLEAFLQNSDFFDKMGMTEEQKINSLEYLLPNIPESPNYYLTILSDQSVNKLSQLEFSKDPEQFIRKYFAVYPTKTPVKTFGDLVYPEYREESNDFTVIETGEILIQPEMFVFWE